MTSAHTLIEAALGKDPRGSDPVKIAHYLDIQVMESDLGGKISGSLVKESSEVNPVILLDSKCSYGRKRFICARLIAFYSRLYQGLDEYEHIDFYEDMFSQKDINKFAVELLVPQKELARLLSIDASTIDLALNFSLPKEYISWYLDSLTS